MYAIDLPAVILTSLPNSFSLLTSSTVSRPRSSPDDLKALTRNVNQLNESFRDMQLRLLQAPLQTDLTEQVWKVQDALQNQLKMVFPLYKMYIPRVFECFVDPGYKRKCLWLLGKQV